MFLLRLHLDGVEDKAGVAGDTVEFVAQSPWGDRRRAGDRDTAPDTPPTAVYEKPGCGLRSRGASGGSFCAKSGYLLQQRSHRGFLRHGSGGLADEVDDAVASADVFVEFLQCAAAGDDEVFLHGDVEGRPLEIPGEQFAVGEKLAADHRKEELPIAEHRSHRTFSRIIEGLSNAKALNRRLKWFPAGAGPSPPLTTASTHGLSPP